MTTTEHISYLEIEKIVINKLKQEARGSVDVPVNNWAGDGYLTQAQLKASIARRKRNKKGYRMLLNAFKLLNY